jgi:hypothetical protein
LASTGTKDRELEIGSKGAQFIAAEKRGEGRRKKSSREQRHPQKPKKTFDITGMEMFPFLTNF